MLTRMLACLWIATAITGLTTIVVAPCDAGEIGKGSVELALNGAFEHTSIEEAKLTNVDLGTRLTYSLTNRFAVGGTVGFSHLSTESGLDTTSLGLSADLIVNATTSSSVIPFIQISLGMTTWSGTAYRDAELSATLPFVGAGLRTLMGDHASVNLLAGYRYQKNAFGIKDVNAHDIVVSFGVSVFPSGIQ